MPTAVHFTASRGGPRNLLAAEGFRTTWGATPHQDQVIGEDATVVRRLEEAGAILVAKLTLGALARGGLLVRRADPESMEPRARLERLLGRLRQRRPPPAWSASPWEVRRSAP